LDPEGGKLSKRKGSVSVDGMLKEGYLPEALLNFVILLGWAPKDNRELFTLPEFVEAFDPKGFQKANPVFNRVKLDWFNGQYLRRLSLDDLNFQFTIFNLQFAKLEKEKQMAITKLIQDRIVKLTDINTLAKFFWGTPKVDKDLLGKNYKEHLLKAVEAIKKDLPLDQVPMQNNFKVGDFFMDLRIAITGSKFTPPINESIAILGKEESLKRLRKIYV
jgi:glutamyl-tRNA synthetase